MPGANGLSWMASTKGEAESRIDLGDPNPILALFAIPACRRIVAVDRVVKLDEWCKGCLLAATSAMAQVVVITIISMQWRRQRRAPTGLC